MYIGRRLLRQNGLVQATVSSCVMQAARRRPQRLSRHLARDRYVLFEALFDATSKTSVSCSMIASFVVRLNEIILENRANTLTRRQMLIFLYSVEKIFVQVYTSVMFAYNPLFLQ